MQICLNGILYVDNGEFLNRDVPFVKKYSSNAIADFFYAGIQPLDEAENTRHEICFQASKNPVSYGNNEPKIPHVTSTYSKMSHCISVIKHRKSLARAIWVFHSPQDLFTVFYLSYRTPCTLKLMHCQFALISVAWQRIVSICWICSR